MNTHFRRAIFTLALTAALGSLQFFTIHRTSAVTQPPLVQESKRYHIYCVDGKLIISNRDLSEVKSTRGSQACLLESFRSMSEAMRAAKRYGGVGGDCACPPAKDPSQTEATARLQIEPH